MEDSKCLVQLHELIKHLQLEDLNKIPFEIRQAINEKKDKEYVWSYDESKILNEQTLDRKTIFMLSYLNMKYLLNDEQRLVMENIHYFNEIKLEQSKRKKYNPDGVFSDKKNN